MATAVLRFNTSKWLRIDWIDSSDGGAIASLFISLCGACVVRR